MYSQKILLAFSVISIMSKITLGQDTDAQPCSLSPRLKLEIGSYQLMVNWIIREATRGSFRGKTYKDLNRFANTFGNRLPGTKALENSIDFMLQQMSAIGLSNVRSEEVTIPHWIRGSESLEMILPQVKNLRILGLGLSIGTTPGGIEAEALVVQDFDDLKAKAGAAPGKIVVLNRVFDTYENTFTYRVNGASEAAKVGAVAVLVRSLTPVISNLPHTGMLIYEANVTQIPAAAITTEDAEELQRLSDEGQKILLNLKMEEKFLPDTTSRNAMGEIKGKQKPNDVVIISGHIDSWDVGQGVVDDGGGYFISYEALALLRHLNLTPRRTVRAVAWTTEEYGYYGVLDYIKKHEKDLDRIKAVFESDIGTFRPLGLDFAGSTEAGCIVAAVLNLMKPINATVFRQFDTVGSDIMHFVDKNVPALSLNNDNGKYFDYHHSVADTMAVENTQELDMCTALWAASAYVIADLSVDLPRK